MVPSSGSRTTAIKLESGLMSATHRREPSRSADHSTGVTKNRTCSPLAMIGCKSRKRVPITPSRGTTQTRKRVLYNTLNAPIKIAALKTSQNDPTHDRRYLAMRRANLLHSRQSKTSSTRSAHAALIKPAFVVTPLPNVRTAHGASAHGKHILGAVYSTGTSRSPAASR